MKLDTPVKWEVPKREFEGTPNVSRLRVMLGVLMQAGLQAMTDERRKNVDAATALAFDLLSEERARFDAAGDTPPPWRGGRTALEALDGGLAFLESADALQGHHIRRGLFQAVSDEVWVVIGSEYGLSFGRSYEQFKPIVIRWGPKDLDAETAFRKLNHERDLPDEVRAWAKLFINGFARRMNRKLVDKILTHRVWPKGRPEESALCRGTNELDAHLKLNGTELKHFTGAIPGWSMPDGWYSMVAEMVNVFDDGSSESSRTVFWETATPDLSKLKY